MQPFRSILIFCLAFASCKSESLEDKAKKVIRNHLYTTAHDFKSYEPIKFGTLDSAFSSYTDLPDYETLYETFDSSQKAFNDLKDDIEIYGTLWALSSPRKIKEAEAQGKDLAKVIATTIDKIDSLRLNYVPEFVGWKMYHSYRINNVDGNSIISHFDYYFDPEVTKISSHVDVGEADDGDHL